MSNAPRHFFDHRCHKLQVANLNATLDILAFHGRERLSQPFDYRIEFTCPEQDLGAEQLLRRHASFSLHAPLEDINDKDGKTP